MDPRFFPAIYGPRARYSVLNLQYGPKTRLIRGIHAINSNENCFFFSNSAVVYMRESCKLDPVSILFWTREIGPLTNKAICRGKMHYEFMLTETKFTSMQKRRKF